MNSTQTAVASLLSYRRAGYPIVAISTVEERRFLDELKRELIASDRRIESINLNSISALQSISTQRYSHGEWLFNAESGSKSNFNDAFRNAAEFDDTILLVHDWQHVIGNGPAYRTLLDSIADLKSHGSIVILIAPHWKLPAELEHEIPVIEHGLPTRQDLNRALDVIVESIDGGESEVSDELRERVLDAARGLTLDEAESAIALSLIQTDTISPKAIEAEKMQLVKKSGFLEYSKPAAADQVGGLGGLKTYLAEEVLPVKGDDQLRVRGLLLVGVPGTGKSLAARAAGSQLNWPVLRLDVASLKGGLVGQSEQNMRAALQLAEAVSPCVLWLDEIEKGIGGFASSAATDGGTTLGMVGILLTWLQEHNEPILTIGTCNDYDKLPPELTRAGRFDERFFVDLPNAAERREIATVHLDRFDCTTPDDVTEALSNDTDTVDLIVSLTDKWTGAEVEQLVKSAARRCQRQPTATAIRESAEEIKPISKVKSKEIKALQDWAAGTLRVANTHETSTATRRKRAIRQQRPDSN